MAATCLAAMTENWPQFRGPTAQGVSGETGVPAQWSESENVVWKTPIPYRGWSSPIIFGDRVFVTGTSDDGVSCHVVCLDRLGGRILWDTEALKQRPVGVDGRNSHASATPVTDGEHVVAFFSSMAAAGLTLDGRVAWTNTDTKFHVVYGPASSPVLYKNLVIINCDGTNPSTDAGHTAPWDQDYILALDKATGRVKWKTTRGSARVAYATPILVDVGGQPQLISTAGDVVQALNPATGEKLWTVANPGEGLVPSPVSGDGLLFTTSAFPTEVPGGEAIRAWRLGGDPATSRLVWECKKKMSHIPSMVYAPGFLFSVTEGGAAMTLKGATGEVAWERALGGAYGASPLYADGKVYFLSEQGKTTVVEAAPPFKVIAENRLPGAFKASPAVSHKQIFIRSDSTLYCIGAKAAAR